MNLWPVKATSKNITSGYGWRTSPTSGKKQLHAAIDIGASSGTPIYATLAGIVKYTGFDNSGGNHICIYHPATKQYSGYNHCSTILAKKGDDIQQGAIIAAVGSTGDSTGPHLHFAVGTAMTANGYVVKDKSIDPAKLDYLFYNTPATPVAQPGSFRARVIVDKLNVRKGPSTLYRVVDVLGKGVVVTILRTAGNWGQLGTGRWISVKPSYIKKV